MTNNSSIQGKLFGGVNLPIRPAGAKVTPEQEVTRNLESVVTLTGAAPTPAVGPALPPQPAPAQESPPQVPASPANLPMQVGQTEAIGEPLGQSMEMKALIQGFLERPEVQAAARDGTAGRNLGLLMTSLSGHLGQNLGLKSGNVYAVGDTEGRSNNNFQTLKDQGLIFKDSDQAMRFREGDAKFLFMGDLGDRGPESLNLAEEMLSLLHTSPGRVGLIWGNRDLGKLAIHNDLPLLADFRGEAGQLYKGWLEAKIQDDLKSPLQVSLLNTKANQVQYWLETHSAGKALQFHQEGLQSRSDQPVSLEQAANDYVERWKPGGTFFEFLKQGSFVTPDQLLDDSQMAVHGGAARENISAVPGEAELPANLNGVLAGTYQLGKRLIAEAEDDLKNGRPVQSMLLSLGDSRWMATAGINAARAESFIYSERNTEDGNSRGHEAEVAKALLDVGKKTELVGHTPIGSVPEMRLSPEGTAKIFTDSSMDTTGSESIIACKGELTMSVSRVGDARDGKVVFFAHQPGQDTQFGKVTSDGHAVVGMTLDGNYFLSRYEPGGRKLSTKVVTPKELETLNPTARRPVESDKRTAIRQKVSAAIENKMSAWRRPILDFDNLEQIRQNRTALVVSAASSYGKHPARQEDLLAMSFGLKETFGGNIMIIDGGTSVLSKEGEKAPELVVQEALFPQGYELQEHGPKRVAAMPSVPNLDNVTLPPDAMVVAGEGWHVPVIEAGRYAASVDGAAVFIGGGGAVAKAIEAAREQKNLRVFLVAGRGEEPMGASDKVAREPNLPAHFHVIYADELGDLGARLKG